MSETYKIAWVGDTIREWAPQAAPDQKNLAYEVKFEGDDRVVEWSRKKSTDAPKVGETTPLGDIKNSPHGDQFKVNWQAVKEQGGGGGGSRSYSSNGTKAWVPEGERDPEKVARIGRAHAQGMALQFAASTGSFAEIDLAESRLIPKLLTDQLRPLIDWFQADVDAAAKTAQGAGAQTPSGSAATVGPSPAPAQRDDTHQRIESLLEEAGVNADAARVVASYAVDQMTPQEQDAAIDRLQNPNTQTAAVNRLKDRAESFHGEPLPESYSADDDIPF